MTKNNQSAFNWKNQPSQLNWEERLQLKRGPNPHRVNKETNIGYSTQPTKSERAPR